MKLGRSACIAVTCLALLAGSPLLTGCERTDEDARIESDQGPVETGDEDKDQEDTDQATFDVEMSAGTVFADGFAWAKYRVPDTHDDYYACIDASGEVQFVIPNSTSYSYSFPTSFENGYSYLVPLPEDEKGYSSLEVIDTNGDITQYGDEEDALVVAYGGGHVVLQRHESGFDADTYSYEIYDAGGVMLNTLSADDGGELQSTYCGNGVFNFQGYDNFETGVWLNCYYCSAAQTFVKEDASQAVEFVNGSDFALLSAGNGELKFMSSTGEIMRRSIPEDLRRIRPSQVSDRRCVLYDGEGMYVYDLDNDSLVKLPDKYAERINFDYYDDSPALFSDDRCALVAKGDDGDYYLQIFDSQWNLVFGPIPYGFGEGCEEVFSEGLLSIPTRSSDDSAASNDITYAIYDVDGNVVFESDAPLSRCEEGVFLSAKEVAVDPISGVRTGYSDVTYLNSDGSIMCDGLPIEKKAKVVEPAKSKVIQEQ